MFKLMMGFAAGYWVASRRAAGQAVVPEDVQKQAEQTVRAGLATLAQRAGAKSASGTDAPLVVSAQRLQGYRR